MKKIFINTKLVVAGIFLMVFNLSCTNLDEEIFSEVTQDNFFQSDEEFISALGAAYTQLYSIGGNSTLYPLQEVTSDEVTVPQRGNDWEDGGNWRRLHEHTFTSEDDRIIGGWNFVFGGINDCNRLIFQFDQLGAEGSEAFIAELKVLRALFYYWALDLYGNVPIVERFDVEAGYLPETQSRQEVYDFVEKEILENIDLLSTDTDASTYGRINYFVAQTILAKLYLNAEVYTGTPQWEKANTACDVVINSGRYNIVPAFFDNFADNNGGSPEFIFAIPYDKVFAQGFNLPFMFLHGQSRLTFNLTISPWNGFCSVQEFYESFEEGDIRKESFLVGPQFTSAGEPLLDPNYEQADSENPGKPVDPDGPQIVFTPEINELFPLALKQAGVRVKKWEYAPGGNGNLNNDFSIFRYADVLMMKAEAMWRMDPGSADALTLVNQVRLRGNNPIEPLTSLTAEDLLAERGREFFSEIHRRQDLIRFGEFNKAWWAKPASDPSRNIFPIPRPQLDANPNLTQNPGY